MHYPGSLATPPPFAPFVLPDGSAVLIRPLAPGDRPALARGFAALSDASRRLRFHSAGFTLGRRELDMLMDVDGVDRAALVAVGKNGQGLGIARYVRDQDRPSVAEPAVTVIDHHQGRGIGTLLLTRLAKLALANGIQTFAATVLSENTAMVRLMARLGVFWQRAAGGVLNVEADLKAERVWIETSERKNRLYIE